MISPRSPAAPRPQAEKLSHSSGPASTTTGENDANWGVDGSSPSEGSCKRRGRCRSSPLSGGEAVAAHHLADRGEIGWAAGRCVDDRRHLAEVVRAEDAG